MTTPKPPIHCTPCRVTYQGVRYQIETNGEVRLLPHLFEVGNVNRSTVLRTIDPISEPEAKLIRREASRQRRNRNARERTKAMKDLGLKRGTGGATNEVISKAGTENLIHNITKKSVT